MSAASSSAILLEFLSVGCVITYLRLLMFAAFSSFVTRYSV